MDPNNLPLNENLEQIVSTTSRALNIALGRNFQSAGIEITPEQWSILRSLWRKDGQCQYELAECQGKDRPSITRLVDNMEKSNLVIRISSKEDRRIKLVYLTNKGKGLEVELTQIAEKTIDEATIGISETDIEKIKEVLKAIRLNIFK